MSHADGTLQNFNDLLEICGNGGSVSAMYIPADNAKYTAAGGVKIIVSNAGDGMMTTREGKLTFDVIPVNGKWVKA